MSHTKDSFSQKQYLRFLIPSLLGVLLFLIPVEYKGQCLLLIGIFVNFVTDHLKEQLPDILFFLIVLPTVISLIHYFHPVSYIKKHPALDDIFTTSAFWLVVKTLGAVIAVMTYFSIGPSFIYGPDTGGNILYSLLPICGVWFFTSGLFLPLLTEYGFMDVVGTIFKDFARPLFLIPGRALIDCFSSWIGSGVCGTVLTASQYETGYYTAREAAIIITNFSVVGISFCSAIAQYLDLMPLFFPFYMAVVAAGLICAFITPRIAPLNKIGDSYNPECGKKIQELSGGSFMTNLKFGIQLTVKKAAGAPSFSGFCTNGLLMAFSIIANTAPVLMSFGTIALILANYTSFFRIVSLPIYFLLNILHVPYAAEAAPAFIIGFADQFLPVIIGATIPSVFTRFIIGTLSILQVIYITEIGAIVLNSKVPLKLWQLFVIFLERTFISFPIVLIFAHLYAK